MLPSVARPKHGSAFGCPIPWGFGSGGSDPAPGGRLGRRPAVGARAAWGRLPFSGALFLCVAAGYAGARLVLESMRESALGGRMPTIHHAISVAVLVSSLAMLTAHWPN